MAAPRGVTVYDPNRVNGYGRELADVLAELRDTRLYVCRGNAWAPRGPRVRASLAGDADRDGVARGALLRLTGPLLAFAGALRRKDVLVIAWTRDGWDTACAVLVASLSPRVVVVSHNPSSIRPRPGLAGRLERVLKRRAVNVVHSGQLLDAARGDARRVSVIPHPPYDAWVRHYLPRGLVRHDEDGPALLVLGALRADKGIDDVRRVVEAVRHRPLRVVVAGTGDLPGDFRARLHASGATLDDRTAPTALTDAQVADALGSADLMLAPYASVTQSGAVTLAVTAGLPVAGYAGGGLTDLLEPAALTPPGDPAALARTVDRFLDAPFPTAAVTAAALRAACVTGWRDLLERVEQA